MPYKDLLNPLLQKHEGFRTKVYFDSKGNPTIGSGLNLKDPVNVFNLEQKGFKLDDVLRGQEVPEGILQELQDIQYQVKEDAIRKNIDPDMYEGLTPAKKASLISLGYNSMNNVGPKLREHIAKGNDLDAMREMVLGSKYDVESPGLLKRRLEEAQLYGGPEQMQHLFRSFGDEDKAKFDQAKSYIKNEHELSDFSQTYDPYMQEDQGPKFTKLNKLIMDGATLPGKPSPLK